MMWALTATVPMILKKLLGSTGVTVTAFLKNNYPVLI